ncbi:MAG: FAD-binding oxidoreductase, partial [Oscillospiraceae bacterium]
MNEIKNASLFNTLNDVPTLYPWLSFDEECEVLVIGGGVTGCMAAHTLSKNGVDTVLITDRPIGYCSTSIDSSTLNYQNEIMLTTLSATVGRDKALSFFNQCGEALDYVEELAGTLDDFDFARRNSFLYTDCVDKINDLHTEYLMRKHNGFDVEFLEKAEARELFSFEVKAGILSKNSGGELDCYKFCHTLAAAAEQLSTRIYENTPACEIIDADEGVVVITDNNKRIKAKKIVFAMGYKQDEYLNRLTGKRRSFFLATSPVDSFSGFESRALVKNISSNINLRSTKDNRIIISGLDCATIDTDGRFGKLINIDRLVSRKYGELKSKLGHMLCGVSPLNAQYQYNGIYGTTKDSMPIIGEVDEDSNTYFN